MPAREFLSPAEFAQLEQRLGRFFIAYAQTLLHERRALLERFRLVDIARKVVGVGSVGTHAWVALLLGRDSHDPVVMQVKEAQASVFEEYVGRSPYGNAGERVVAGQRMMQAVSDIFLGWLHVDEGVDGAPHDYYVRQLRDWKGSIVVEAMDARALARLRRALRGDAGAGARAHGRSHRHLGLPGPQRRVRPRDPRVQRRVCGAERARLPDAGGRRRLGPDRGLRAEPDVYPVESSISAGRPAGAAAGRSSSATRRSKYA